MPFETADNIMRRIFNFFAFGILLVSTSENLSFGQHSVIFPQPQYMINNEHSFKHNGVLTLPETEDTKTIINVFAPQFMSLYGIELKTTSLSNVLFFKGVAQKRGFYKITVNEHGVEVSYNDFEGLTYAMQSLLQLTNVETVQGVIIEDYPTFNYRGVHLDCARHFFTISEIKGLIDELARLKFNTFHWHLTDDQGWRIEIKKYPKLTSVGAWRDSTLIGHFSKTPIEYDHVKYGGFYTQEQAKEIVAYAKHRGIDVIPEIELPGHAMAALAAYPQLGCTGKNLGVSGTWGVFDDVFCTKDETLNFLKDVLAEVVEIFPSKTIHVGGDETPKVRWEVCEKCQAQIHKHGLHNEHELQSFVIGEMGKFLQSKGKTLMGWDEILEGGLVENAQVMSWRGTEGGIAAAKAKHNVVMTPTSYCYFDYYQSGSPGEPLAIGGYLPLEKVYNFNPIPEELTVEEQKYILGGQANLWTEYLQSFSAVQYMLFPRLVAMSEVLWTESKNRKSYNEFVVGLNNEVFPYYTKKGINYSRAAFEPKVNWENYAEYQGVVLTVDYPLQEANVGFERTREWELNENVGLMQYRLNIRPTETEQVHTYDAVVYLDNQLVGKTPVKIHSHLALGIELQFVTPPSGKYNVHGDLGLTDGVVGSKPWKGNQWLGFENDTVQFMLDFNNGFGKTRKVSTISLGTLDDPGSWIYRPKKVEIEYSSNGKKWTKTEAVLEGDHFVFSKKMKVRYLKFTVINDEKIPAGFPGAGFTPWTFLDELIITK